MSNAVATQPMGFGALTPTNLEEALRFADIMAKSSIVPKDYQGNPGNVLVAVQWGMELGLQPLQAMQNIAVINGRPSIWGDAVLALVRASGLLESIKEEISDSEASCTVKRRGEAAVTRTFTMDDAKRAGLAGKSGPWQQYPKRMLQMRARSFALRDVFTDVLKGMPLAEDVQDEPVMRDVTPSLVEDAPAPQTKTEAVKQRIAAKKKPADTADLDAVLKQIGAADTEDDLKALAGKAGALADEAHKAQARDAYLARLTAIREANTPHEPETTLTEDEAARIAEEVRAASDVEALAATSAQSGFAY